MKDFCRWSSSLKSTSSEAVESGKKLDELLSSFSVHCSDKVSFSFSSSRRSVKYSSTRSSSLESESFLAIGPPLNSGDMSSSYSGCMGNVVTPSFSQEILLANVANKITATNNLTIIILASSHREFHKLTNPRILTAGQQALHRIDLV